MADSQKQNIINSIFSKKNSKSSAQLGEIYVSHIKVWEDDDGGGKKPRYLIVSVTNDGYGFIRKAKLNINGSFSVGKIWRLEEMCGVKIVNPLEFTFTIRKIYRWQSEKEADQATFLKALIRLFRTITNRTAALKLEGTETLGIGRWILTR
ncbi:exocyst complex component SEC3 N-terminal PIP2 binding PH-domain-containing protein [Crucibulum laeve]|uniref:Exocyst complex component SEC3 N-terminal PIP2 binding PH-domain-containing protein n=1 Tax=Crucibulum laeve TaxID=68775 RepID=A0A5C3M6Q7_9AGAR|nr:exocyst complex component SEC3 N-terminal PIP2 binding PH-domain-containing protein [Crucibulum laeve]